MDAKERVEHWKFIVRAVFAAEDSIKDKWKDILKATKNMSDEDKHKVADEYVTAVAKEILSKTKFIDEDGKDA